MKNKNKVATRKQIYKACELLERFCEVEASADDCIAGMCGALADSMGAKMTGYSETRRDLYNFFRDRPLRPFWWPPFQFKHERIIALLLYLEARDNL